MGLTPSEDTLSALLTAYRLQARVDTNPRLCGEWQLSTTGTGRASFHLVGRGGCYLHMADQPVARLEAGDLLLLPHDHWHLLSSRPDYREAGNHLTLVEGDDPADTAVTQLLCGHFHVEAGHRNPLLASLPPRILVRGTEAAGRLDHLAHLMRREVEEQPAGHRPMLDRLADTLLVLAVRHYIAADPEPGSGNLLAALADPGIRVALDALHARPEADWGLEDLAREAAMSRSRFAERFRELVGKPAMEYLTGWRMTLAEGRLHDGEAVARVMEVVGYTSEPAFRKAFKRFHGHGPGRSRRRRP